MSGHSNSPGLVQLLRRIPEDAGFLCLLDMPFSPLVVRWLWCLLPSREKGRVGVHATCFFPFEKAFLKAPPNNFCLCVIGLPRSHDPPLTQLLDGVGMLWIEAGFVSCVSTDPVPELRGHLS